MDTLTILTIVGAWISPENAETVKSLGLPIVIACGLFGLFAWFLKRVTNKFFTQMESANDERQTITERFTNLMETTIQVNTAQLKETSGALSKTCEVLRTLERSVTEQHGVMLDRLHELGNDVSQLKTAAALGNPRKKE